VTTKKGRQNAAKLGALLQNKKNIQAQIDENDRLREEAYQEYLKEKAQVDAVV